MRVAYRPWQWQKTVMVVFAALAWAAVPGLAGAQPAGVAAPAVTAQALAQTWDREHLDLPLPPLLKHAEVEARLRQVLESAPDLFSLEQIGQSVEGRSINHLWFGRGPMHVLLWSQMHGDEPTATSALFDLFEHVRRHRADAPITRLLDALTIHVVPMLNPDGAERFQRRNAQSIDINRDALLLQAPEGRALKALRDRLNPQLGFNLHNQNWRTSAGRTGRPASISLLAVAYDEARSENEGRLLAKKTCAVLRDAIETLIGPQVALYDDEFEVRAFGDNVTKWGTPVVLIETGPLQGEGADRALVRVNFVAILSALDALATGRARTADPARYESLPMNDSRVYYLLINHATIAPGTGVAPFLGDVAIGVTRSVTQRPGGEREFRQLLRIDDLGDMRVFAALESIDATALTLAPLAAATTKVGDEVTLPDPAVARPITTVTVGAPAELMLLRPTAQPGRFSVERVIRAEVPVR